MPAIREYTNPIDSIRPNNAGMGAVADLASAQGRTGYYIAQQIKEQGQNWSGVVNDVGKATAEWYDKNRTKMEISQGGTLLTGKEMDLTNRWNERVKASDPNDASIGPKFLEEIEGELEKTVEGATSYGGREWMRKQVDNMKLDWFKKVNSDLSTRTGQALKDNFIKTSNQSVAVVAANPTTNAIDRQLSINTDMIDGAVANAANLTPGTAAELGTSMKRAVSVNIVTAGLQNMIEANPEAGRAVVNSGKYSQYLDATAVKQLDAYADAVIKRQATEQKAVVAAQKEARTQAFHNTSSKIYDEEVTVSDQGNITIKPGFLKRAQDLLKVDPSKQSEVRSMLNWATTNIEKRAKGETVTDNGDTYNDFASRIFLGPDEPNGLTMAEVYQAGVRGELSDKSFRFFRDAVQKDYRDPNKAADYREFDRVMKSMRPSFVRGSLFGSDDGGVGERNFMRFRQEKWEEYRAQRQLKVPANKLLSEMTPESIIKDFRRYILTPEQQMEAQAARLKGSAGNLPTVKPAEGLAPSQFEQRFFGSDKPKWDGKQSMDELFKAINGGK